MEEGYVKQGYLYDDFRMFHILDHCERDQNFHYHEFYKIVIFISGNVSYNIEGKSYKLFPYDIVLVSKGDIHKPEYVAGEPYERVVFFISERYLERHKGEDYNLANCFAEAKKMGSDVLRFPAMVNTMLMEQVGKLEKNGAENRYAGKLYANALFMELLVLLNRACLEEADCFSRNVLYNQKMIDIIRYINEH
ncbi:MAG: AraC family ligand binding domain-containing protein, partial [Lachnospiraceae bacterium]|nr:AraC family ligand binding domain-containing protein [Lachnospiraceae bacterium]